MPKMKTHSGSKKRFKVTANLEGARPPRVLDPHPREESSPKKKRRQAKPSWISKHDEPQVKTLSGVKRAARMTRVKRSVHARKKRRATLALHQGLPRRRQPPLSGGQGGAARPTSTIPTGATASATSGGCGSRGSTPRRGSTTCRTRSSCTVSSSPASSSTARSSRTSPSATPRPSDALPTAPARRWRPAESNTPTNQHRHPGAAPSGGRFFLMITSPHNAKLKEIRKLRPAPPLARTVRVVRGGGWGGFVVSGRWAGVERHRVVCRGGQRSTPGSRSRRICGVRFGPGFRTRTLAVYEERRAPAAVGPLCVYLHGVHDPGNVGVVPLGARVGASCVALGPGTADAYSPKAVRASMGAVFAVPGGAGDRRPATGHHDRSDPVGEPLEVGDPLSPTTGPAPEN